jgi:hypothetical protein
MAQTVEKPTGRQSIFRDKKGGDRVQGIITPLGSMRFELARTALAKVAGREKEHTSDADTIEWMAHVHELGLREATRLVEKLVAEAAA